MTVTAQQIEALRAQIADARAELAILDGQPVSRADVADRVAAVARDLDSRAARWARIVQLRIAAGDSPTGSLSVQGDQQALLMLLVSALGSDAIVSAVLRGIEANVSPGLAPDAWRARRAELLAELDRLEFDEEGLIEASEAEGAPVARRADARAEIILAPRG